ncbi:hypothetical protein KC19_10G042500 [Ceratodon purpureus]|uniref:Uncharacterized protein n=1 Tax=Ceratodon purpureus TaxID=3225 RepID=A0A8T0GHY8_CERPU|nr:hypothetical protein KC19_10G042500 [Ceratodon purpureus]
MFLCLNSWEFSHQNEDYHHVGLAYWLRVYIFFFSFFFISFFGANICTRLRFWWFLFCSLSNETLILRHLERGFCRVETFVSSNHPVAVELEFWDFFSPFYPFPFHLEQKKWNCLFSSS